MFLACDSPAKAVEVLVEHGVEAADSFITQVQILRVLVLFDSALSFGLAVELLGIQCGELTEFYFSDVWHDVLVDIVLVVCRCSFPDGGLGVILEPSFRPLAYCELACFAGVDFPGLLQCRCQLFLALLLDFCEDIFVDGFSRFWIVARCVSALPAAVLSFTNVEIGRAHV